MKFQEGTGSWGEAVKIYRQPEVIRMIFLGFSAGLPLLLVFSTLTAWLTDLDISRTSIGFFGWVGITYSIKFFWAPIVDRLKIPWLTSKIGQRRSWILLGQIGIILGLIAMVLMDPRVSLFSCAICAVLVAFSSSTQDIAIDALRIESAKNEMQGALAAAYQFGYRVGMLIAGAGALYMADLYSWSVAYYFMATLMLIGVFTVLLIPEPNHTQDKRFSYLNDKKRSLIARLIYWLQQAFMAPFFEFFKRNGSYALIILVFISVFRLSDITMGIMANPFYLDLGFTKSEIAGVSKIFGFFMTLLGAFLGGLCVLRYGIHRPLIFAAILTAITNLLFVYLSNLGNDMGGLILAISGDNISGGFSGGVFIAYLSSLTNRTFTATQYALFTSLMTLPGKFFSGFSGLLVDAAGYQVFFFYAALMGIPAILLSWIVWKKNVAVTQNL
jgi:PAT family beta-lactamase induction signal transducer AmpG